MEIIWTKTGKDSLKATLKFIKLNFGDAIARNIRNEIETQTNLLSLHPFMGKKDSIHSSSTKTFRYIIIKRRSKLYYYLQSNVVYIVLVWDVRQDIKSLRRSLDM
ncbi:MAG: type II toxin-antitoxin system RelE/ParE family toxin [Proteiniphilum sp.]|nr:type II toxin-antitoxin system RelE/ParE family toxin [Proteiniphilum sp.]